MHTRDTVLGPADVQASIVEVDLAPAEIDKLCRQAVPVCQKHHCGVALPMAVVLRGLQQPLDFVGSQILTRSQVAVFDPLRRDCPIYGGLRRARDTAPLADAGGAYYTTVHVVIAPNLADPP
jgi:hypothetical protein